MILNNAVQTHSIFIICGYNLKKKDEGSNYSGVTLWVMLHCQ